MKKKMIIIIITILVIVTGVFMFNYVKKNENISQDETKSKQLSNVDDNENNYNFEVKERNIESNGSNIYGLVYIPKKENEKMPIMIFSHGLGGTHNVGAEYAEYFAQKGIATYTFDFRGGSSNNQSDGETTQMSVMTEVDDLENIIDEIKTWDFVDTDKIILIGESQCGLVSALTASKKADEIAGLILMYPAFVVSDEIHQMFSSKDDIPDTFNYKGWIEVGRNFAEDVWDVDLYKEITNYKKDVLLIHGTSDSLVNTKYSEKANKTYEKSELKLIDGAGHGFYEESLNIAIEYIWEYLNEKINNTEIESKNKTISNIKVIIDDKNYNAILEDNETAQSFVSMLPVEYNMNELNGNEKYIYLDNSLPTNLYNPKHIEAGDIMFYGNNCLVVFYKSFDTSYRYTKIGHIEDLSDLGNGNITIKFEK